MSETEAPTPDEVAKARIYFAEPLDVVDRVLPQMARHVRVLLAALDAADRERDELARWKATHSWSSTLRTRAETAEADVERLTRERDESNARLDAALRERDGAMDCVTGSEAEAIAWLDARLPDLRAALLPPGEIVVSLDAETREAVAKALLDACAKRYGIRLPPNEETIEMAGGYADAAFVALRERAR